MRYSAGGSVSKWRCDSEVLGSGGEDVRKVTVAMVDVFYIRVLEDCCLGI